MHGGGTRGASLFLLFSLLFLLLLSGLELGKLFLHELTLLLRSEGAILK